MDQHWSDVKTNVKIDINSCADIFFTNYILEKPKLNLSVYGWPHKTATFELSLHHVEAKFPKHFAYIICKATIITNFQCSRQ